LLSARGRPRGSLQFGLLAALLVSLFLSSTPAISEETPEEAPRDPRIALKGLLDALDRAMVDDWTSDVETDHFRVRTTDFDEKATRQLAETFEAAFYAIDRALKLPTGESDARIEAFFFAKPDRCVTFLGRARGGYFPPGAILLCQFSSSREDILETLTHEATHAYLDRFIVKPDVDFPVWLNEGFASYMGYSLIVRGELRPGVYYKTQRQKFAVGAMQVKPKAAIVGERLSRSSRKKRSLSLADLLAGTRQEFQGKGGTDYYDLAWAFVHYLRDGVPEGKKKFAQLIKRVAEGDDTDTAFQEVYGCMPLDMQEALVAYIRKRLADPPPPPDEVLGKD